MSGPEPSWARRDGGDAGLHPSDIQHTPYTAGTVSYSDDRAVVLGPDGPTLGRSASPATVVSGDRWKLGQLRPGITVEFVPVTELQADDILLVEYGEMTLDLRLRMRVHALATAVARLVSSGELTGIVDVTPGIRSLQLHVDPDIVPIAELLGIVRARWTGGHAAGSPAPAGHHPLPSSAAGHPRRCGDDRRRLSGHLRSRRAGRRPGPRPDRADLVGG